MNSGLKKQAIPRRPLLWFAAALVFTVPPMFGNLVWWVPVCFLAVLIAKFLMEKRGLRLRSSAWKLAGAAAMLGCIQLHYHTLTGLAPGLSISILLIAIKILEAHTARDFHILALLGWFLCLTGLFVSQGIGAGLYAGITFWLILTAMAQFHRGGAAHRGVIAPLRASGGLVLLALPFVAVMFFLFPRGSGPFRFELKHSFLNRTGMSDHLSPGSVAALALSNEVAFRVEFPDGHVPRPSNLYWRGAILVQDDGLDWSPIMGSMAREEPEHVGGIPVRQRIVVQPNNGQWLFALNWPHPAGNEMAFNGISIWPGNTLHSGKPLYSPRLYEVNSFPRNRETKLRAVEKNACLQLPGAIPPQVSELVKSWMVDSPNARTVVARAMDFFHKEGFTYSISPGAYGPDGLDDFLFHRRTGFCEHYAAAFGTLMRLAGIPSRVVVGYQGGQFNSLGDYLVVRQSDAHAWCEVWIAGIGWERADPTAAVAPGRVDMGFASYMDLSAASREGVVGVGDVQAGGAWSRQPLLRKIQLAWDTISYEWDAHVLNFDEETQQTFFLGMGWLNPKPIRLFALLLGIGVALLCLQSLWLWWKGRVAADPVKTLYERFCRRVAALGVEREPWEGPMHFAGRAAELLPTEADGIQRVARVYISARYSVEHPGFAGASDLAREIKAFCERPTSR